MAFEAVTVASMAEIRAKLAQDQLLEEAEASRTKFEWEWWSPHGGLPKIPCSRNDEGEASRRVIDTMIYAFALLGGPKILAQFEDKILRLHDHKGVLCVYTHTELPKTWTSAFWEAWDHVAYEYDVEFINVRTKNDGWCYWGNRSFKSDWIPTGQYKYEIRR